MHQEKEENLLQEEIQVGEIEEVVNLVDQEHLIMTDQVMEHQEATDLEHLIETDQVMEQDLHTDLDLHMVQDHHTEQDPLMEQVHQQKQEKHTIVKNHTNEEKKDNSILITNQETVIEIVKIDTLDQADTLHLAEINLEIVQNHLLVKEHQELLKDTNFLKC